MHIDNMLKCCFPVCGLDPIFIDSTRAASIAENAVVGESSDDGIPNEHNNGSKVPMRSNGGPQTIVVRGMTLWNILPAKVRTRLFSGIQERGYVNILELQYPQLLQDKDFQGE